MRLLIAVVLSVAVLSVPILGSAADANPKDLGAQFKHPGPEYRGVPFLSLNDDLKGDELAWQIHDLQMHHAGGAFLHARIGRITPFMSEEWLNLIERCVKESKAVGTSAWLYDEDRWPSGFASGVVPAKGMEYRAKSLDLQEFDVGKDTTIEQRDGQLTVNGATDIIAMYSCTKERDSISDVKRLPLKSAAAGLRVGMHVLLVRKQFPKDSPGFNGYSYVDTLEPKVIKAFIDAVYEPYYKKLGGSFGKEIPGIFTDEPNITPMSWTERLPDEFKARYGYDILDVLPSLYYEAGDWQKVRYDYHSLTCDMFNEAYSKQIYDWCDAHHLQFTGHYLAEDSLVSQLQRAGSVMPHYEYEHMPGIDHLFRRLGEIALMKQVSSVANQLGKKRVLSETYGGSGWNMSFADQKWIANWQLALGVNFMNQHLCHYSLRGTRKRDWPASIYFQQPYWQYYNHMNDYLGRACLMLTQGDFIADVLVVHPIGSAWCVFGPKDQSKARNLSEEFKKLSADLVELHREFEYGDEKLMAKYGKVQGRELGVGRMKYKAVIIPPSVTLSGSTLKLLEDFASVGGSVIAIRPTPTRLDGTASSRVRAFFDRKTPNVITIDGYRDQLEAALQAAVPRHVSIKDALGLESPHVVCHRRQDGSRQIIFLANTDPRESYSVTLKVDKVGKVEDWNLATGDVGTAGARVEGSGVAVDLDLPGGGSKLLVLDESAKPTPPAAKPGKAYEHELSDAWTVQRHSPNALTLDYCGYRIGTGEWKGPVPVYKVQQAMDGQTDGIPVSVRFSFTMGFEPSGGPLYLVLEQPNIYTISVNGRPVRFKDAGWWVDKSFRKLDIGKDVHSGENIIEMTCKFVRPTKPGTSIFVKDGVEIEAVYIIGDFAVEAASIKGDGPGGTTAADGGFKLMRENHVPIIGDLTEAGYPFFAGDIELRQDIDVAHMPEGPAYLEFDGLDAITARVYVNGKDAGAVFWRPYRLDITSCLEKGANKIQVVLSNSLRNLLGPLHNTAGELTVASPGSFTDSAKWTDSYYFVKLGIPGKAHIVWED